MGWLNYALGLGTSVNSITATTYQRRVNFDRHVLDALFRQSGIARKIITRLPFDATREGWTRYPSLDAPLSLALQKEERRLRFARALTQALIYERLYGGAAVVLDLDDGQEPWQPLARDRVRQVRSMRARHRWELWPHTYVTTPGDPDEGEAEIFAVVPDTLTGRQSYVHRSRMLIFEGELTPGLARQENWGWGDSVIETIFEELRNAGIGDAAAMEYLLGLSIPVAKIKGWWKILTGEDGESEATRLLSSLRQRLSAFRVMAFDADDSVERLNASVGGLAEILNHHKAMVAAVTPYPQTLLYGDSPSGMDATGTSDLELYYGSVRASVQEDRLREPLELGLSLIVNAPVWGGGALSNPIPASQRGAEPEVEFKPLWLPSAQTQAQTDLTKAQTRQTYASLGWLDADEGRRLLEADGLLISDEVEEDDGEEGAEPEDTEPEEEVNPLAPPREVSAAVAAGLLASRRAGYQPPTWEASVAQRLAGGRPLSTSQALQLERILADDPASEEDDRLRVLFGGAVTQAWLATLSGARTDAEDLRPWRGRVLRVEVRAGERRSFPGTRWPDTTLPCDYGEIVGSVGLDGESVDVLLYPGGDVERRPVHVGVILHPDSGDLDEAKLVLGAPGAHEAQALLVLVYGGLHAGEVAELDEAQLEELLSADERADAEEDDADERKPTKGAAEAAARALEVRASKPPAQRGMTPVGLARARDIANRRPLSRETWRRVKAYFDRHESDKQGETWDEQGKGWQAWQGWGGDAARAQAEKLIARWDR